MSLEEDIKVKEFRNSKHKLLLNIFFTNSWILSRMQTTFKSHGITIQQYNILRILRGKYPEPSSIRDLKSRMMDKMPDASRLVDRLIVKGLVERSECPEDRRKMDVVITGKGLELLTELDNPVSGFDSIFDKLTEEEIRNLNDSLDKIRG